MMQPARSRWSTETVASSGVVILGATIIATGTMRHLSARGALMLVGGAAWIVFISLVSALVQNLAPDWVRARVLAVFMLFFQGGMAAGSAAWGAIATRRHRNCPPVGRSGHNRDDGPRTCREAAGFHGGHEPMEPLEDARDLQRRRAGS